MVRTIRKPAFPWLALFWRCGNPDCGAIVQFEPEDVRRTGFRAKRTMDGAWSIADLCEFCGVRGPWQVVENPDGEV